MPENNAFSVPEINENIQRADNCLSEDIAFATSETLPKEFFKVSFEHYKDKECGIKNLAEKTHATKALQWLRGVGLCSDEEGIKSLAKKPDDDKPLYNSDNYSFLFSKLPEEFSAGVREYKLSSKLGRIFYCVDAAQRLVHCLLIHHAHFETDKNRR